MNFDKLYELFCKYYQDDGSNDEIMKSRIEKAFLMYAQNQGQTLPIDSVVGQREQYTCECKVCGKPFGDKLSLYEHYDEEHN